MHSALVREQSLICEVLLLYISRVLQKKYCSSKNYFLIMYDHLFNGNIKSTAQNRILFRQHFEVKVLTSICVRLCLMMHNIQLMCSIIFSRC